MSSFTEETTQPDTLQETTAETGGHQHVADANIGICRQMLKLEIVRAAVTGGNDANVVTQNRIGSA